MPCSDPEAAVHGVVDVLDPERETTVARGVIELVNPIAGPDGKIKCPLRFVGERISR